MALRKPLFMGSEPYSEEMAATDSIQLGGLTMSGDIAMGGAKVTGLGAPTADGDAATKLYVDQKVINGGSFKEALLHEEQVDDAEGVLAATALVFSANPASGDTITITDGTTTRTYGAGTGGDVQYTIGATPADSMTNFAAAVIGDGSAVWGAYVSTDLDAIAATTVVLVEDDNDGTVSRVYGVWATPANIQHVDFDTEVDYTSKTLSQLDATDPTASNPNFGIRRTQSALTDGELHYVLNNDVVYGWDDAGNTWQTLSGSAGIPDATAASGGGTKGKVTADSDKGLDITTGILEAKIDAVTIDFDGSGQMKVTGLPSLFEINGTAVGANVTAPNLDTLTGGGSTTLHTHAVVAHQLDGSDHTVSGLTTGHVLQALTPTTFGFAAVPVTEVAKGIENVYTTATDATANGDPVYWNGVNTWGKADSSVDAKARVVGVIESGAGAAGSTPTVVSHGKCTGVLSTATPNTPYYLQSGGGIGTSLPGAANRVIRMGLAMSADDLWVDIVDFGKRAA